MYHPDLISHGTVKVRKYFIHYLSGILVAYKVAPVRYKNPMIRTLFSDPFSNESDTPLSIKKCIMGKADMRARDTKTTVL